jgi:choline dehydrogenase-like flavoprotein
VRPAPARRSVDFVLFTLDNHEPGTYDYVVVGGGTAGCVLAARLSENDAARVLMLEAGGAQPLDAMAVPAAWPALLATPANWGEATVAQAATSTTTPLARGRALGGSSAINAMMFARGHHSAYDAWTASGASGWGFDDLVPYFQRSEDARVRDGGLRGVGGPLGVGPADPPNPVITACLEAAAERGHPRAGDLSGGLDEGFGLPDLNIVDGLRQSAADAFLAPVSDRPNLDVVTGAVARRLIVESGRCTGVEYGMGATAVTARCSGEVVLTAGTIGSAQLLMLSGIGPAPHLEEVGVDVVLDLPGVGSGLQDHPVANVVYGAARPIPFSRNNHGEAFGLLRSDPGVESPDFQLLFMDAPGHLSSGEEVDHGYSIGAILVRPRSRGTVRLANIDPDTAPLLDPDYYGDPEGHDLATMVTALRAARDIGEAHALDGWREREVAPGPTTIDEAALRAYATETLGSVNHPVGTCPIGSDDRAVVDPELRVRGIAGLRVADASVMPSLVTAYPIATVYAIAERAADLIAGRGVS